MYQMEQEINIAVQWWTDILRKPPTHDTGNAFGSAIATGMASNYPPLSEEQLRVFAEAFKRHLTSHILRSEVDVNRPAWGSALRTVGVTYIPCEELNAAAIEAGIEKDSLRFPFKTMMWIDPGEISVRQGYGQHSIVWQRTEAESESHQ